MENKELLNLILRVAERYYSLEYDIYSYEDNIVGITITTLVEDDFSKSFMVLKASELIEESKKFNANPYEKIELQDFEDLYVEYEYIDDPYDSDEADVFEGEEELDEIEALEEEVDNEVEVNEEYEEYYPSDQSKIYQEYEDEYVEEDDDEDEVSFFLEFKTTEEMEDFVIKTFY